MQQQETPTLVGKISITFWSSTSRKSSRESTNVTSNSRLEPCEGCDRNAKGPSVRSQPLLGLLWRSILSTMASTFTLRSHALDSKICAVLISETVWTLFVRCYRTREWQKARCTRLSWLEGLPVFQRFRH